LSFSESFAKDPTLPLLRRRTAFVGLDTGRQTVRSLFSRSAWDLWRRSLTQKALHGMLRLGRWLGPHGAREAGRLFGGLTGLAEPLRRRLADNFRAAGIAPTEDLLDRYFRRLGDWAGWSLAVYEHGLDGSGVTARVEFDESVRHFDEAVAQGRGVVLVSPHFNCHEILAACTGRRHPVAALIRESKSSLHNDIKRHWYDTLGMEVVHRARHSSLLSDTLALLRVLRSGRVLGVTPDLVVPANKGVPVRLFGRTVTVSPGFAVLALRSGAPILTGTPGWIGPPGSRHACLRPSFEPPTTLATTGDRETTVREAVQAWATRFEAAVRAHPETWLFWLDKRWTEVLRQPPASVAG
jgi:lauroyl/myristoyl acyltransferase